MVRHRGCFSDYGLPLFFVLVLSMPKSERPAEGQPASQGPSPWAAGDLLLLCLELLLPSLGVCRSGSSFFSSLQSHSCYAAFFIFYQICYHSNMLTLASLTVSFGQQWAGAGYVQHRGRTWSPLTETLHCSQNPAT